MSLPRARSQAPSHRCDQNGCFAPSVPPKHTGSIVREIADYSRLSAASARAAKRFASRRMKRTAAN